MKLRLALLLFSAAAASAQEQPPPPSAAPPVVPAPAGDPPPVVPTPAATPVETPVPAAPPAEAPAPVRRDGGVPAEAVQFHGTVTGTVDRLNARQTAFRIKVTGAKASDKSKAARPEALVGVVVQVRESRKKATDGQLLPEPGHREYIAGLKPGATVTVDVRYEAAGNALKLTAVPAGAAAATPAPAPAAEAPAAQVEK